MASQVVPDLLEGDHNERLVDGLIVPLELYLANGWKSDIGPCLGRWSLICLRETILDGRIAHPELYLANGVEVLLRTMTSQVVSDLFE